MKKFAAIAVVIALMLSCVAFAESIDLTSLTDEELDMLITNAIVEQWRRKKDHYKYFTDDWEYKGDDGLSIRLRDSDDLGDIMILIFEVDNDTDDDIQLQTTDTRVNGWDVDCYCYETISAHGRRRCNVSFNMTQADIASPKEIDEFKISFIIERARDNKELYTVGPLYYE